MIHDDTPTPPCIRRLLPVKGHAKPMVHVQFYKSPAIAWTPRVCHTPELPGPRPMPFKMTRSLEAMFGRVLPTSAAPNPADANGPKGMG